MRFILFFVLLCSSFNTIAGKASPRQISYQENLSTRISFFLPYIKLENLCSTESCLVKDEGLIVKIGNSKYLIYEIFIANYSQGMNWEDIFMKNLSVSLKMREVKTQALYNIFINLAPEVPCAIGQNNRLNKSRVLCKVTEHY